MLLPLTFVFEPTSAFVMFAGIYYGGMYGGSTTAILLNIPGETASIPTTLEGYPMARAGRAGAALATAAIGSFVAGTISTVVITFLAPAMSSIAKLIQPAEYFSIMVLAFVTVTSLMGSSIVRGLSSLFLGLAIGLVGIDQLTGQPRLRLRRTAALRRPSGGRAGGRPVRSRRGGYDGGVAGPRRRAG